MQSLCFKIDIVRSLSISVYETKTINFKNLSVSYTALHTLGFISVEHLACLILKHHGKSLFWDKSGHATCGKKNTLSNEITLYNMLPHSGEQLWLSYMCGSFHYTSLPVFSWPPNLTSFHKQRDTPSKKRQKKKRKKETRPTLSVLDHWLSWGELLTSLKNKKN